MIIHKMIQFGSITLQTDDIFLASDSELDIYVSGKAGHQRRSLVRYRSPGKNRQSVGCKWNEYNPNCLKRDTCIRLYGLY